MANLEDFYAAQVASESPGQPPVGRRGVFGASTERGVANLIQGVGGLTELLGAEETGRGIQEWARPLAERAGPSQYGAADLFTNPIGLATEAIAENLPLLAGVGAGSLVGRGAVAVGARAAAKKGLELTAKQAANRALVGNALSEGVIASSTLGSVYAEQPEGEKNRARALATGLPSYWLERMGGEALARGVLGGTIKRGQKLDIKVDPKTGVRTKTYTPESRLAFATRKAAETALIEGPLTEAPQTVLEALGTGEELTGKNLLDAVVKGSIAGGAFGGGFGFFTPGERKTVQDRIRNGVDTLKLDLETGDPEAQGVDLETGQPGPVRPDLNIGEPLRLAGPPPPTDYVPNFVPGEQVEGPPRYGVPNWALHRSRGLPSPGMETGAVDVQTLTPEEAAVQLGRGFPGLSDEIAIQPPFRMPPGIRVGELTQDEVGGLTVEPGLVEEISLDGATTPEAFSERQLASSAPGPTAMGLAFTNALQARMQAQRQAQEDAAHAARAQAEARARAPEEDAIQRAGQRAQLEEAATAIEQGGKPPSRFMRADVDSIVTGVTADIAATGGKAAMPRGLKAKIYAAMGLGHGKGNYGTQIAGLTRLLGTLDQHSKSYEIVGRLLDTLRGAQSETQQAAAAPTNDGGTQGSAAVSRPRKRAAKVSPPRKQADQGDVPASTGSSEAPAKAEVKGERDGAKRKATDAGRTAPGQPATPSPGAAGTGGPASAVRPRSNQTADDAAERAGARRGAGEKRSADGRRAPAKRTPGRDDTAAKGGVVQPDTRGVRAEGDISAARGTSASSAAPSGTAAPAVVGAKAGRDVPGRAGRVEPEQPDVLTDLASKEKEDADEKPSAKSVPAQEQPEGGKEVRKQDTEGKAAPKKNAGKTRSAKAETLPQLKQAIKEIAHEMGVPESHVENLYGQFIPNLGPDAQRSLNRSAVKGYTWDQPRDMEDIRNVLPLLGTLKEQQDVSQFLDAERSWWYDLNWAVQTIRTKGQFNQTYKGTQLGKRLVRDPASKEMKPLWEVMAGILQATPAQIAQARNKVEAYENRDKEIFAKRSAQREETRKEEDAYRASIIKAEEETQKDLARTLRQERATKTRSERRAPLQKKSPPARGVQAVLLRRLSTEAVAQDTQDVGPRIRWAFKKGGGVVKLGGLLDIVAERTSFAYFRDLAQALAATPGVAEMTVRDTDWLTKKEPDYFKNHPDHLGWAGWFLPEIVGKATRSGKQGPAGIFIHPQLDTGANSIAVLHEALHAATWWNIEKIKFVLSRPSLANTLFKAGNKQLQAGVALNSALQFAREAAKARGLSDKWAYPLQNLHEFVATALTETEFQNFLQSVSMKQSIAQKLSKFFKHPVQSVYDLMVHAFQRMFDTSVAPEAFTVMDAVIKATPTIMGASAAERTMGVRAEQVTRAPGTDRQPAAEAAAMPRTPSDVFPNAGETVGKLSEFFTSRSWVSGLAAKGLKAALGWMTLGSIQETFQNQFPQLRKYFTTKQRQQRLVTELNNEVGEFLSKTERLIAKHGGWDVTKGDSHPISILYRVMGEATLAEYFPDRGNIYNQPRLANKTREEADKYLATPEGKKWLDQVNAIKSDWQSLNDKDPALGRLFSEAYKLNKQRYDQSLKLFKQALVDNMYDGVFPSNIREDDVDAKEKWLREENDRVRPGGFSPDPHRYNVVQTVLKPLNDLQKRVAEVRGPYFHLGRFGEFAIRWLDNDGVVNMKRFENRNDFLEALNALVAEGANKRTRKVNGEEQQVWYAEMMEDRTINEFDRGSDKFVQSMLQRVEVKFGDTDPEQARFLKQSIRAMYLQMLPDTAFYKVFQKRKGNPGYDPDMLRSFGHRAEIMNRTIGYGTHARDIQKSLGELRAAVKKLGEGVSGGPSFERSERGRMIVDELRKREMNGVSQPNTPWIDTATSLNYMFYLALSPAYIITNLTQPWMLTMPFLGGRHGWVASAKALGGSTKTAWAIVRNLIDNSVSASKDADWITQATVAGRPSLQFKDMEFLTEGQKRAMEYVAAHGQLDLTLTHEVGEVAKLGATSRWGRAKTVGGLASHYSEIVNRVASGLAAYDLEFARTKDQAKAEERALKIVRRTQFDYSHANLARMMSKQGIFSKYTPLIMAFQRFNAQLLEAYVDTTMRAFGKLTEGMPKAEAAEQIAEARKTLAGMLGTSAMFAGLMGLPAANLIFAVLDKLFGSDDEPADTKALTRQWFADIFGNSLGEALTMGPSRLAGINLQRVGQQDIVPLTRLLADKRELKDMFEAQAVDTLGPVVGGAFDILNGAHKIMEGRPVEGLKTALPLALRGPVKAFEMGTGYTTDSRGNPIPINFNSWDVINQAFGFAPPKLAERQAALYTINTHNRQIQQAATKIRQEYYRAVKEADGPAMQRAIDKVREWNTKHGADSPILGSELAQGLVRRERQFQTGLTLGPGVGVATYKDLPKLDIAKWANVGR